MHGHRLRRQGRLPIGAQAVAILCAAGLTVLAACGGGSSQTSTEFDIDQETTYQEILDTLTASEQECVRDELDDGSFESALEWTVLGEVTIWDVGMDASFEELEEAQAAKEELDASLYGCLDPEAARDLILATTIAAFESDTLQESLGAEFDVDFGDDEKACLQNWIPSIDPAALVAGEDDLAAVGASFGVIACVPDLLIAFAIQELAAQGLGVEPDELSEDEKSCLREWVRDIDPAAFLADEDDFTFVAASFGMFACLPDLVVTFAAQGLGVEPDELSEDEKSCLREWARDIDPAALTADEDDPAAIEAGLVMFACVPDLFASGIAQGLDDPGDEFVDAGPDDHADWYEDATVAAVDEPIEGAIEDRFDIDYFVFQAESGVVYQIDVAPITMSDPYVALYDTFEELAYSDDYIDLAPRIQWKAPSSGTYYVAVEGYDLGTYTLLITLATASNERDDHADWFDNATVVEADSPIEGVIERDLDIDFFEFRARAGEAYQIDVTPVGMTDPTLELFDSSLESLEYSDDQIGLAPRIQWEAPSSGTYYVAVEGYDLGSYTLTIATT